jgi:hypothetical protein
VPPRRHCTSGHVTEWWAMRCHHSCTAGPFDALLLLTKYIMLIRYAKIFFEMRNGVHEGRIDDKVL